MDRGLAWVLVCGLEVYFRPRRVYDTMLRIYRGSK
jgi:hypothetical protein